MNIHVAQLAQPSTGCPIQSAYLVDGKYPAAPLRSKRIFVTDSTTIQIGRHRFEGPFRDSTLLLEESGVFVVLGGNGVGEWRVLDIGESDNVCLRMQHHERSPKWRDAYHLMTAVAALYVPAPERVTIERELRSQYLPFDA